MLAVTLIGRKRDGGELTEEEIAWFVEGLHSGQLPDSQIAAMAMAICCRGMSPAETSVLTRQMLHSGSRLQWANDGRPVIDKHSTGGLGDKTSLILAPLLAECGCRVPMISGRGLGATGGTLDKLDSIPGFRSDLSPAEMMEQVDRIGCFIASASAELAPADRRLYAIRDITGTVPSIPLITASIMSKKLAESPHGLVLDVKWGSGAFMKTTAQAEQLAASLVETGRRAGVRTTALLTDMNQPLGEYCGNACEVMETMDVLRGGGPADLRLLTEELAVEALLLAGLETDAEYARRRIQNCIDSGRAWEKFLDLVEAQGGQRDFQLQLSAGTDVLADREGVVSAIQAEQIGLTLIELAAGRRRPGDVLDYSTGVRMHVRIGDAVVPGQPLLTVYATDPERVQVTLQKAVVITDEGVAPPLISSRISTMPAYGG